jgi:hypothetical protein
LKEEKHIEDSRKSGTFSADALLRLGNSYMASKDLLTVAQLLTRYQWLTRGRLRELLFFRHRNGLHRAVVRLGRTLLLDFQEFEAWCAAMFRSDVEAKSRNEKPKQVGAGVSVQEGKVVTDLTSDDRELGSDPWLLSRKT